MANQKISQMAELQSVTGEEYVPVVTNGANYKVKAEKLKGQKGEPGEQGEPGKPGESLTWDKMTEEDKEALKASVVKEVEGSLVQVEPVDETEYEDYFNDIKTVNE